MAMSPTSWSSEFETGITWQDFQHKELVSQLLLLHNAILSRDDKKQIEDTMKFLDLYIKDHFGIEEQYMASYDYPDSDKHLAAHQTFIENYQSMKEMYHNSTSISAVLLLCYDLNQWIFAHIKTIDQKLGEFLSTRMANR